MSRRVTLINVFLILVANNVLKAAENEEEEEGPLVEIEQGVLQGLRAISIRDQWFFAFLGVPYASPPVGDLRFRAPQSPKPWRGIYNATSDGESCPQHAMITGLFAGQEDCLFLNIYTPQLPSTNKSERLKAVMVWFHGGCFKGGSGSSHVYGPDYLLTEDVILVTVNYRLGLLGFLSLPGAGIPGNNGMKDQVMALRWVKRNIAKFGGDPDRVTIFGESAGGASAHLHLLSPMSKGLFQGAIAQSGTALHDWAFAEPEFMINKAFTIGERMNCKFMGEVQLLQCLQNASAELIVDNTIGKIFSPSDTLVPMRPTLEDVDASPEENFLLERPAEIMYKGTFDDVFFMTGVNSREGIIYMQDMMSTPGFWDDPKYHLVRVLGDILDINSEQAQEIAEMALSYYTGEQYVYKDQIVQIVDLFSDVAFVVGAYRTVRRHAELSNSAVYMYLFSYDGILGLSKLAFNTNFKGASHADELGYLFHTVISPPLDDDTPEMITALRMTRMWTNFAKTGDPTPVTDDLLKLKWRPVTSTDHVYMNISEELHLQHDLFMQRMQFWEDMLGPFQESGQ